MMTVCGLCLPLASQPNVPDGGTQGLPPIEFVVLSVTACIILLVIVGTLWSFAATWVRAQLSGAPVSFFDVIAMRIRRSPVQQLVEARVRSRKAGLEIGLDMWEANHLARGNVEQLLEALIRAHQGRLTAADFTDQPTPPHVRNEWVLFNALASHNLAGGNPLAVVDAMIALREKDMAVTFHEAAALDLCQRTSNGKQMVEAVAEAVERRRLESNQIRPQAQGEGNA